jgi:branched-subunit amino acid transport protein
MSEERKPNTHKKLILLISFIQITAIFAIVFSPLIWAKTSLYSASVVFLSGLVTVILCKIAYWLIFKYKKTKK